MPAPAGQIVVSFGTSELPLMEAVEDYCAKTGAKKATVVKAFLRAALANDRVSEEIVREVRRFRRVAAPATRVMATA